MTVDHLPQTIADLAELVEQADDVAPASEGNGTAPCAKKTPEPAPAATTDTDDNWQQSGFGSFP